MSGGEDSDLAGLEEALGAEYAPGLDLPDDDEAGPSDMHDDDIDPDIVRGCAGLDASDTDNGLRLRRHFGPDMAVLAQEGVINKDYLVWTGTHWDGLAGLDRARILAQRIGGRIALEAAYLNNTPEERKAIKDAAGADPDTDEGEALIRAARAAKAALEKRKARRRAFGVTSKNTGRIEAMLTTAAPHLTRSPESFNLDPLTAACATHTLRFFKVRDAECPDPDAERWEVTMTAEPGHRREDWITQIIPVAYAPAARCPRFTAFMERFQPNAAVRRAIQVSVGASILGVVIQRFFFHYGSGANGKSVFLETISRVLGGLGIGLPSESIIGTAQQSGGGASPDIARLFGKRFIRVLELAPNEPLKEALLKKLTGGEKLPARSLFKGFFEFQPIGKPHGSGNGYPRIDGTDNGIWRRMTVFEWPVQLAPEEQREFEVVLGEFLPEYSGILNWLVEGAKIFLQEGFVVPDAVKVETAKYRAEQDPISEFAATCIETTADPDDKIAARNMYHGYVRWCMGNGAKRISETRFGRLIKTRFDKVPGRVRHYASTVPGQGLRLVLDELPMLDKLPEDGAEA